MSDNHHSELNDIIEGFQMFSSDTDGLINPNELKEIMEIMNMNEKNPFLYNIINQLCSYSDINQKGGIDPGDFISLLDQELNDTSSIEGLEKIFTALYTPSTNTILLQNIPKIDNNIEKDETIKTLFSKPEVNGKEIDFNKFVEIMKKNGDSPKFSKTEKVYKKKISMKEGRESYHSEKKKVNNNEIIINNTNNERNDLINNEIKKVEINFNNKMINNNNSSKKHSRNNSMNSTEKMENVYFSINRSMPHFNEEKNNENGNDYYANINNDINNFDNNNDYIKESQYNDEPKEEEITSSKKKYRHMRKKKNKDLEEGSPRDENNTQYETNKQNNISNKTRNKRYNNDENEEITENVQYKEDNNDDNENNDLKSSKRYHRRYRETKSNNQDKNEEKEYDDN